jgi:hypothetical protein
MGLIRATYRCPPTRRESAHKESGFLRQDCPADIAPGLFAGFHARLLLFCRDWRGMRGPALKPAPLSAFHSPRLAVSFYSPRLAVPLRLPCSALLEPGFCSRFHALFMP